jgi:hypothetical protein
MCSGSGAIDRGHIGREVADVQIVILELEARVGHGDCGSGGRGENH